MDNESRVQLDENGREIPDPTPIVLRTRQRVVSNYDDIRAFIRGELSRSALAAGTESFEDANDFDIEDDPIDPQSRWEYSVDNEREDREVLRRGDPRGAGRPAQESQAQPAGARGAGGPPGSPAGVEKPSEGSGGRVPPDISSPGKQ